MNIESMAVSAVQNAISKTDYLGEQISKGKGKRAVRRKGR